MLKSKILALTCCFFGGILIVALLSFYANRKKNDPNGFIRVLPPHVCTPVQFSDLKYNSFYLAGIDSKFVYLGNFTAPDKLVDFDYNANIGRLLEFHWPDSVRLYKDAFMRVDSPNLYLGDGIRGMILQGKLDSHRYSRQFKYVPFSLYCPVKDSSITFFGIKSKQNILFNQGVGKSIKYAP